MMTIGETIAHLQLIGEHEDNDLSPNDEEALATAERGLLVLEKIRALHESKRMKTSNGTVVYCDIRGAELQAMLDEAGL